MPWPLAVTQPGPHDLPSVQKLASGHAPPSSSEGHALQTSLASFSCAAVGATLPSAAATHDSPSGSLSSAVLVHVDPKPHEATASRYSERNTPNTSVQPLAVALPQASISDAQ